MDEAFPVKEVADMMTADARKPKKPKAKKAAKPKAKPVKKAAVKKKRKPGVTRKRPKKVKAAGNPRQYPDKTLVRMPKGWLRKINAKVKKQGTKQGDALRKLIGHYIGEKIAA